jgi:hypothetical protein
MMCAKSKALWLVFLPALLLTALVMTTAPGGAAINEEERNACHSKWSDCTGACSDKAKECGPDGTADNWTCYGDCTSICDYRQSDCLTDADKDAPKLPATKIQPKMQPGGAEDPVIRQDIRPNLDLMEQ